MSAQFLAWYTCIVLGLGCVLATAVSLAPGDEWVVILLMGVKGAGAVLFAGIATVLNRMPQDHWSNRSVAVRGALLSVAVIATLFLVG